MYSAIADLRRRQLRTCFQEDGFGKRLLTEVYGLDQEDAANVDTTGLLDELRKTSLTRDEREALMLRLTTPITLDEMAKFLKVTSREAARQMFRRAVGKLNEFKNRRIMSRAFCPSWIIIGRTYDYGQPMYSGWLDHRRWPPFAA